MSETVEIKLGSYFLGTDPDTQVNYVRGKCVELLTDDRYLFGFYAWDENVAADDLGEFRANLSGDQVKEWQFFETVDELNSRLNELVKRNE